MPYPVFLKILLGCFSLSAVKIGNDAVVDEFFGKLSPASKITLKYQGGPMTESEAKEFEFEPLHKLAIKLRSWDDRAKKVGWTCTDLDHYRKMVKNHLNKQ